MTLKERIENNLVLWILGFALSAFLMGVAAYEGILRIAQLDTVRRGTYVDREQYDKAESHNKTLQEELVKKDARYDSLKTQYAQDLKKRLAEKEADWPLLARAHSWIPASECSTWIEHQGEGRDADGRRVRIQIFTLTQEYRWVFAKSDVVEAGSDPVKPKDHIKQLDISKAKKGIICVGTASSEGGSDREENRAKERADNLLIFFREGGFKNLPALYGLNLGQFNKYKQEQFDPEMTRDQRRVIVNGIIDQDENVNLEEAIKDALIKAREAKPRIRYDIRHYSALELFPA